ncbi:MAG TPA: PQQ-binding-like beta-propeller repeat protein [Vicinamibacterales bacterium]|nr:PQQ-binding-like beta-propeller repeat protein [Vicinamibacterales bacterium]
MLRALLKIAAAGALALIVGGGVLYQFFGLRLVQDGGRLPGLRFTESPEAQAERIRLHREAQRAQPAAQEQPARAAQEQRAPNVEPRPQAPNGEAGLPPSPGASADHRSLGGGGQTRLEETRPPAPYWTDFRGPLRDGHYRERPILTTWPAGGLTPLWKQPVGGGYASFAIARGRAFTIEQRGREEVVAAYDVVTGREQWTNAWAAEFRESMGGDGPRATPTWADSVVYALGATGELRALDDASGRVLWRTNVLTDSGATNLDWGMSAAPLVVGGTLVVLPGGPNGRSIVAYDRHSGKRSWSALGDPQAYVSPMLVTLNGVQQILVFSASRLMGIPIRGGDPLWEYPWRSEYGINAAQPLVLGGGHIFLSSSYAGSAAVIEVTGGTTGFKVREVWRNNRMKNRFASSVLHEGIIYGLDESILAAIDAKTGDLKWKGGRYGYGQVLLADGHLIVLTEDGDLALVRATPARHEELARFHVLDGKTWNVPAIADGYLLVRNLAEMAAFDLRVAR